MPVLAFLFIAAFVLSLIVLIRSRSRYRWLLCATFLVQAYIAAIFAPSYGLCRCAERAVDAIDPSVREF